MGNPAKVPNPFTAPATEPTKNFDKLWFRFLFLYPFNKRKAKIITVKEIIKWVIFGSRIDNKCIPNGVPRRTPNSKYNTNFQLIFFQILGNIKKLAIISNNRIIGTISFGGITKDNNETLDAEKPKPLKPLTVDAKSIIPQKNKNSKNDKSIAVNIQLI